MRRIDSGFVLTHGRLQYEPVPERRRQLLIDGIVDRARRCYELLTRQHVSPKRRERLTRRFQHWQQVVQRAGIRAEDVSAGVLG